MPQGDYDRVLCLSERVRAFHTKLQSYQNHGANQPSGSIIVKTAEEFCRLNSKEKAALLSCHVVHIKGRGTTSADTNMDDILAKLKELQIHSSLPRETYGVWISLQTNSQAYTMQML